MVSEVKSEKQFIDYVKNEGDILLVFTRKEDKQRGVPLCKGCEIIKPYLEDIELDNDITLLVADVGDDYIGSSLANQHAVRGLPSFVLFKDGKKANMITGLNYQNISLWKRQMKSFCDSPAA